MAAKKTVRGSAGSSKTFTGDSAENKIQRRQKKLASSGGGKKPSKIARKGTLLKKLDAPIDTGKFLAFVVGDEVRMVPRKPRGKSKRVGCTLRNKPNKAGGSRKMTKAQVAAEFERSFFPYLHDDVAVRTAWNDHVDLLHKQGLVSAVVANSSVPAKFLKRKSNRAGGRRPATRPVNKTGGRRQARREAKGELRTYYSLVIPYTEHGATPWHPTERTGPFSTLTSGVFKSVNAAHKWAKANLGNTPYSIRKH